MCKVHSGQATKLLNRAYLKHQWHPPKSRIRFYSVKNYINVSFDLAHMAAILDFIHGAVSKSLSGHTIMSEHHGRHHNQKSARPTILSKIIYCLDFHTNGGHL